METVRKEIRALWTVVTATVVCERARISEASETVDAFFREVRRFESRFSRFLPGSEVWNANENVGKPLKRSAAFVELWSLCENMRERTDGYFDARIESAISDWGYRSDPIFSVGRDIFDGEEFPAVSGTENFRTDARIDFWGVGKGCALDLAKARFDGFPNVCVVAGGDVFAKWRHASGNPFTIALEHPLDPEMAIGEIRFSDWGFVAGSSANRRSWGDGRGHIADPKTGKPANRMLATFVHAREWWLADAWATAFFAMGYETAKRHAPFAHWTECLLVSIDGTVFKSDGFLGKTFD